tara:strand:+ start:240 stop:518 length:279 start_codon:yes stop_codon:yes gene_type:complete
MTKYNPRINSIEGPTIKPIKCPIEDDGDDGTVQGLKQTMRKLIAAKVRPKYTLKSFFEDIETHRPIVIKDIGSQKNITALIIVSIYCPNQCN